MLVVVLDDVVVVVAALFVGRRYTIVATWPFVDVYVNVEYESRWQYSRNGSKDETLLVPPLRSEPASLMQAQQASTAMMKGELGAHNSLCNPLLIPIAKASSNDDILALKLVES